MSDLELRKEIPCAIKFAIVLATTAPETVKLMNEAYKDKCFCENKTLNDMDDKEHLFGSWA